MKADLQAEIVERETRVHQKTQALEEIAGLAKAALEDKPPMKTCRLLFIAIKALAEESANGH